MEREQVGRAGAAPQLQPVLSRDVWCQSGAERVPGLWGGQVPERVWRDHVHQLLRRGVFWPRPVCVLQLLGGELPGLDGEGAVCPV